jgi:predicted secreted Zn-dependent protease
MRSILLLLLLPIAGVGSLMALRPSPAPAIVDAPEARGGAGPLASPAGERGAIVRTRDATETYPVTGGTAEALLRSLVDRGPSDGDRDYFGLTASGMQLRYRADARADDCALIDVEVTLDVTVTLPAWDAPAEAPPRLRRDWRRFLQALERHEDGHRERAHRGADKVRRAIEGLRRPSCAQAEAEARHRLRRLETEIEGGHRLYDEETGHGRTQGAVWPLAD